MKNFLQGLRDPEYVWRFQNFFGIRKTILGHNPGGPWSAVEVASFKQSPKGFEFGENISKNERSESHDAQNIVEYRIENSFWYILFLLGSQLGDETGGALLFSFWFWNVDGSVGRRMIFVWNIIMYIGCGLKDIVRWDRPQMPHVVQMEKQSSLEYGMPSTHSMVGLAVPVTLFVFSTNNQEDIPLIAVIIICSIWCFLVCTSRLYLGMHSLADIFVGLLLSGSLLPILLPLGDKVDNFLLTSSYAPLISGGLSIVAVLLSPKSDKWTPARGISTCCLGCYLGVNIGLWMNVQLGIIQLGVDSPEIYQWSYGLILIRSLIGGVIGVVTRSIVKPSLIRLGCFLLRTEKEIIDKQDFHLDNKKKVSVDLFYKFLTYIIISINCVFLAPIVFSVIGCDRRDFYRGF